MTRFNSEAFEPIDSEEKAFMDSIEGGQWASVGDVEKQKEKALAAARTTLKKDRRINLRLTEKDYYQIQLKAIEEGIPYQTLIASLVHKYLNGTLVAQD